MLVMYTVCLETKHTQRKILLACKLLECKQRSYRTLEVLTFDKWRITLMVAFEKFLFVCSHI